MTAHEQIRQALVLATEQHHAYVPTDGDVDDYETANNLRAFEQIANALSLLDSHAVVPREPTDKQYDAASDADRLVMWESADTDLPIEHYHDIYKAMIQAAQEESDE